MSAISPVSTAATQSAIATLASSPTVPQGSSQTDSSSGGQPAVIVSLSSAAGETQNGVFAQPLSDQVANELNLVAGANALANNAVAIKAGYGYLVSKYGVAIANRDVAEAQGEAALIAKDAIAGGAGLGIVVQDTVSPDAAAKGAAPGTLSISAFSYASGGNNYVIKPGADGSFDEIENGQLLYHFQGRTTDSTGDTEDAGAQQAVATLSADAAKIGVNSDSSKLSVLA